MPAANVIRALMPRLIAINTALMKAGLSLSALLMTASRIGPLAKMLSPSPTKQMMVRVVLNEQRLSPSKKAEAAMEVATRSFRLESLSESVPEESTPSAPKNWTIAKAEPPMIKLFPNEV